jgi:KUP system potassium uptake protein
VWITVGILVVFFSVQRFGTDKIGYTFAPVVTVWLLLISGIGLYNAIKFDIGTLRAFNPEYIINYFRRTKKKGWVSLGEILLCVTGIHIPASHGKNKLELLLSLAFYYSLQSEICEISD